MIRANPKIEAAGSLPFGILMGFLVLTVVYRLLTASSLELVNTAPLMAVSFGGAMLLGKRFWFVPAAILISSDLFLGVASGGSGGIGLYTLTSAIFYTLVSFAGSRFGSHGNKHWLTMWCGTMIASVAFYVVSNSYVWLASPDYAKTLGGWWQSQTTGLPQYSPPAWAFLRNALIGDTAWCGLAGLLFFRKTSTAATALAEESR